MGTARELSIAAVCAFALWLGACAHRPEPITRVVVRNESFEVGRMLDSASLERFTPLWRARREVDPASVDRRSLRYMLDITEGERTNRWFYSPEGSTTVLTLKQAPVYLLDDPRAMNELLTVDPSRR